MDIENMDRYVPKIGDIFYYSIWWISGLKTGYRIQFRLNFSYQQVYYKAQNKMYQRKIYKVVQNKDIEFQSLIYNGQYGIYRQVVQLGKQKLVRLDGKKIFKVEQDRRPLILDWQKHKEDLIIGRTFQQLIFKISKLGDYFLFNGIDQWLNKDLSTRCLELNK